MNTQRTYSDLRLLPVALALLDPADDPRIATVVEVHPQEESDAGVTAKIDWHALAELNLSQSARVRVDLARSLLDGTSVDLSEIVSFGSATYGLMMRALTLAWPAPPPDVEELLAERDLREIDTPTLRRTVVAPPLPSDELNDWIDPETGKPGCPSCGGLGHLEDENEEPEACSVCHARGVATITEAELWLGREDV